LLRVTGPARALLTAERTALNLLQRMTGIATATECLVRIVTDYGTLILDTRKTVPGLRRLDKYAVKCGGGTNHRIGLHDAILIKDNHLAFWRQKNRGTLADAVRCARKAYPGLKIEIEVDTLEQLKEALPGEPDWVLLDNMSPAMVAEAVALCNGRLQDRGVRRHHQGQCAGVCPRRRHGHFHRRADALVQGCGPGLGFRIGGRWNTAFQGAGWRRRSPRTTWRASGRCRVRRRARWSRLRARRADGAAGPGSGNRRRAAASMRRSSCGRAGWPRRPRTGDRGGHGGIPRLEEGRRAGIAGQMAQ
jgi:hypothetical protein